MADLTHLSAIMIACLRLVLFASSSALETANYIPERSEANAYAAPCAMFDNIFYVGDRWVSSHLVKTSEGLVLMDTLCGRWIPDRVRTPGFNPKYITHILITHGHSDHVGGAEYLQTLFGSDVVMTPEDIQLAKQQAKSSKGNGAN